MARSIAISAPQCELTTETHNKKRVMGWIAEQDCKCKKQWQLAQSPKGRHLHRGMRKLGMIETIEPSPTWRKFRLERLKLSCWLWWIDIMTNGIILLFPTSALEGFCRKEKHWFWPLGFEKIPGTSESLWNWNKNSCRIDWKVLERLFPS